MWITDRLNDRVRRIDPSGTIETVAEVYRPQGVAVDQDEVLYVSGTTPCIKLVSFEETRPCGQVWAF